MRLMTIAAAGFLLAAGLNVAEARPLAGVVGGQGLNGRLVVLLNQISQHYQRPVIVSSGCRSSHGNRRAGGAKHSFHLSCEAADIKLSGISESTLLRTVRALPGRGGVGTYCWNSVVHVDVGPRREWHAGGCGRRVARRHSRGVIVASR
jgi:hypothetical protein